MPSDRTKEAQPFPAPLQSQSFTEPLVLKDAWIKSGIGYRGPIQVLVCSRVANFKTASIPDRVEDMLLLDALRDPKR
ncbi:MAG: hypothetical protein CMJ15_05915 [Pelagibacterium sp.]|nr:hypothetical protein [Pelagibacterium sp.]